MRLRRAMLAVEQGEPANPRYQNNITQIQSLKGTLLSDGFAHFSSIEVRHLEESLKSIGEVIQITDVKVNEDSKALVTSARGLDFHTDHHRADIIVWYCFEQTNEGGESILTDTDLILSQFTTEEKETLETIELREHKIFEDDKDSYPLITKFGSKSRCYYSFWLVDKNIREPQKSALKKFQNAVREMEPHKIKLKPTDVLFVDNGRMLHGRTEIRGNKKRFLKRYWVACPDFCLSH